VEGEKSTEEALDTMLYTLEDYFIDFQSRIHPRPFLRLMGMCYDQMICLYTQRFIVCCTKPYNKHRVPYGTKQFSEKARRMVYRRFKNGLQDISNFFEDAAVDMIGEGYFFGSAKSFHAQMKMINYISDVISDAPLSSLHGEVMLPMLTSYSSQPASIPHVLVLTGQLLLFRCFQAEASMWKAAYPDQARKHSYPYTRYVQ